MSDKGLWIMRNKDHPLLLDPGEVWYWCDAGECAVASCGTLREAMTMCELSLLEEPDAIRTMMTPDDVARGNEKYARKYSNG